MRCRVTFLTQLKSWLAAPVIEASDMDRPFKLRRISLAAIIVGWATFLASTLIGFYLTRHGHLAGYHELFAVLSGQVAGSPTGGVALQYAAKLTELSGAALFIGGMLSVSLFDKRDCAMPRRAN